MVKCVQIPNTDLMVSPVCLGTDWMGFPGEQDNAMRALDAFYEGGGRFIDTANGYCRWLGDGENLSEQVIGRWLKASGVKDFVVATKGGEEEHTIYPELMRRELESSLESLGKSRIDLYYLHRDDLSQPVGDILETMNVFIREGKIRYLGASNWKASRLREAADYAKQHGLQGFFAVENQHNIARKNPGVNTNPDPTLVVCDEQELAYHEESGMTLIPFQSTARGYFSKRAAGTVGELAPIYDNPENDRLFEELKAESEATGVSIQTLTITRLAKSAKGFRLIPLVGANTLKRLEDVRSAMELLSEA